MTVLPIVERELRVASRRPETYWSRWIGPGTTLIFMTFMLSAALTLSTRMLGYEIFQMAFSLNFIVCLLSGVHMTADCISSEKREGTLGFLFLTDLKGFDVILGKLAVTSLRGFYGLLAVLPVMAIPMLLGGVSLWEVLRAGLVLVNTMLFSLSAGILASVFNRDARKAGAWTAILVMSITVGFPLLGFALVQRYGLSVMGELAPLYVASPAFSGYLTMDRIGTTASRYWWAYGVVLVWSGLFLTLASRLVTHNWQDRPASATRMRWRERLHTWLQGKSATRAAYRRRLLDVNPILWLASRNRLKRHYLWIFLGVMGVVWAWGYINLREDFLQLNVGLVFALVLHSVVKLGLASEAGERLSLDLRSGALELILSTRTSVWEMLDGQMLALRRHYGRAALVVLAADVLMLIAGFVVGETSHGRDLEDQLEMGLSLAAGMIIFITDIWALSWVGMWLGIASKDHKRAAGETIARVLLLPWLGVFFVNAVGAFVQWWFDLNFEVPFIVELGMWFSFSLAADIGFARWARDRLYSDFRLMVMRRYWGEQPHQFWALLGRKCGEIYRAVTGWFRASA